MCKYCERRNVVGWEQPELPDLNGNLINTFHPKAKIYDYKTTSPELAILSNEFFPKIINEIGIATICIPIKFCPMCGRKLGCKEKGGAE